jgi:hydroxyethylthiazole kinase
MINAKSILTDSSDVRTSNPLVRNITNFVMINNTASALMALVASSVMAHAIEEVDDMKRILTNRKVRI